MTDMVSAVALANAAQKVFQENPNLPFKRGGSDLRGMDSAGFIHYCCKLLGIKASSQGTNTLYRQIGSTAIPLKDALRQGKVVPGTILFCVTHNGGEPDEYKNDGRGNANFAHICVDGINGIYPSAGKKKIIRTSIEAVSGKANMVAFHPALDYGFSTAPQPPQVPQREIMKYMRVIANSSLNLRDKPSKSGSIISRIPEGTIVPVFNFRNGWAESEYSIQGQTMKGWLMMENFLEDV